MALEHKKAADFSEWYLELVQSSQLMDYTPVQGCMVIRERGYAIWEKIQSFLNARMRKDGVRNAYFPMFIPESLLKQEAEHFAGFVPEVAWVTHGGDEALGERLALRPTSETIMYTMFAKWISSHRDLPLKVNQWCNIIRWDTKALKPFLRTREFLWQEGHTAHASKEEAEAEVRRALDWYADLCEQLLCVPVIKGKKSDAEKFPGADMTTTIEAIMPDGKALQCGTSHLLGQNFAKIFGIRFKTADGKEDLAWQTSWGVSTRLIGALAMVHGDDRGLVLPPLVAPLQVVIVPIFKTEEDKKMALRSAEKLIAALDAKGITTHFDERDERSPGWKFNEWEMKGVPIRVEIGLKDLAKQGMTIVRRDKGEKEFLDDAKAADYIATQLDAMQKDLLLRARAEAQSRMFEAKDYAEFKQLVEKGFVKAGWCGDARCEEAIKEETGATLRAIPFDEKPKGNCVFCGKPAKETAYFARSY
ncbi:proline--tRNA ligase [Candidatus Micrarchaeota archaeon CG08_land_8_20_14_0_20_59_11]|nr:MAG: proline--tRNA ligase [Candidatus Micrarchaeota archaeon CG08_land_8_20_14_0_20_59_11]